MPCPEGPEQAIGPLISVVRSQESTWGAPSALISRRACLAASKIPSSTAAARSSRMETGG